MRTTKLSYFQTKQYYEYKVKLGRFLLGTVRWLNSGQGIIWRAKTNGFTVRNGDDFRSFPSREAAGTYLANSPSVLAKRK